MRKVMYIGNEDSVDDKGDYNGPRKVEFQGVTFPLESEVEVTNKIGDALKGNRFFIVDDETGDDEQDDQETDDKKEGFLE